MSGSYRALLICCCVLVMAALVGCTASQSNTRTDVYQPVVQPGMTWADAVNVLLDTLRDRNNTSEGIKCSIENNGITITRNGDGRVVAEFGFYRLLGLDIVASGGTGSQPFLIALPGLIRLNFADRRQCGKGGRCPVFHATGFAEPSGQGERASGEV